MHKVIYLVFCILASATGLHAGEYEVCGGKDVRDGDVLVQREIDGNICWTVERNRLVDSSSLHLVRGKAKMAYIFERTNEKSLDYDPILNIKKKIPAVENEGYTSDILLVRHAMKTLCRRTEYIELSTLRRGQIVVNIESYNKYHAFIGSIPQNLKKFHIQFKPKQRQCEISTDKGLRETFQIEELINPNPPTIAKLLGFFRPTSAYAGVGKGYADIEVEIAKGKLLSNGLVIASYSVSHRGGAVIDVRDLSNRDDGGRLFATVTRQFK